MKVHETHTIDALFQEMYFPLATRNLLKIKTGLFMLLSLFCESELDWRK